VTINARDESGDDAVAPTTLVKLVKSGLAVVGQISTLRSYSKKVQGRTELVYQVQG
jgi:hypothetical protein